MATPLPNLTGGSAGPSAAKSGDVSAGINYDFTSNNAFSVGGSGKQVQTATASTSEDLPGAKDNTLTYISIGVGALSLLLVGFLLVRRQ